MINHKKNITGFTVIELIIVIAIIAVLSTVIGIYATNYNRKAKIAATQTEVNEIAKAVLLWKTQHGCYPDPETCDGSACDCVGADLIIVKNNFNEKSYFEIGVNNLINLDLPFVYASSEACSIGYLMCDDENEICICSDVIEEDEDGCEYEFGPCGSSIGTGEDLINTLVFQNFLSGKDDVTKDAWGNNYGFVFNWELIGGGFCSFVFSAGEDGESALGTAETCAGILTEDNDIYALIEEHE